MKRNNRVSPADVAGAGKVWLVEAESSLQSVLDSSECPPLLRRTLTGALSWQARGETSVQRALTSLRIAPQWVAALLALGATVTVEEDAGPAEATLEATLQQRKGRHVTALHVPLGSAGVRWGEAHVARTPADEPIVAAIAVVEMCGDTVRQARLALTGTWPEAVRLAEAADRLVGDSLDETAIRAVAEAVEDEVAPRGDFRGSEEYRRAMAGVLTRRALEGCLRREVANEGR